MTRSTSALLASGATLLLFSACAGRPRVTTRYPLAVVGATVDNGEKHVLPVVSNTVIDGSLRIVVKANQAGMIFTVDDPEGAARALVWDEASLRLDADSPRRFRVAPEAQVNASVHGDANFMRVSGRLYRQESTPGAPVTAYAPPLHPDPPSRVVRVASGDGCAAVWPGARRRSLISAGSMV